MSWEDQGRQDHGWFMNSCALAILVFIVVISQPVLAGEAFDAAAEIARQSGLPTQEVMHRLRSCAADQQSLYFCAWRDLVVAEHKLDERARLVSKTSKACAKAISARLPTWSKKRDQICQQSAAQAVGGGSDEPRQRLACEASMTADYARHFDAPAGCK